MATKPPEDDGPVWMVNLMKYREVADYADGRESTISGRQADDIYPPIESLRTVGAEIVFFGDVDQQLLGDDTVWDRIAVVIHPSRRRRDVSSAHPLSGDQTMPRSHQRLRVQATASSRNIFFFMGRTFG